MTDTKVDVEPVAWMDKFGELYNSLEFPMPTDVPQSQSMEKNK